MNVFKHNPIQLNKLNIHGDITQVWIFAGLVPAQVAKDLMRIETTGNIIKSTAIDKFYGTKWLNKLKHTLNSNVNSNVNNIQKSATGKAGSAEIDSNNFNANIGVVAANDINASATSDVDFSGSDSMANEQNFDTEFASLAGINATGSDMMLNNMGIDFSLDEIKSAIEKPIEMPIIVTKSNKSSVTASHRDKGVVKPQVHFVFDIDVFPEDTVFDFKQKICALIRTPIYNQHIWPDSTTMTQPLHYVVHVGSGFMYPNMVELIRSKISVESNAKKQLLFNIPIETSIFSAIENVRIEALDCFRLMSHYYYNFGISTFNMIDFSDFITEPDILRSISAHQLELFYWGFVVLYWPMFTMPVFKQWIANPSDLATYFPDLEMNAGALIKQFKAEFDILNLRYDQPQLEEPVEIAITNSVIQVDRHASNENGIILRNLFDHFALDESVTACKCVLNGSELSGIGGESTTSSIRPIVLEKVWKSNNFISDDVIPGTIMLQIAKPRMYLILQANGSYTVISRWHEEDKMTFKKIIEVVSEAVHPIIQKINSGKAIVLQNMQLPLISKNTAQFLEINLRFMYKAVVAEHEFAYLNAVANQFTAAGIFMLSEQQRRASVMEYFFRKGMFQHRSRKIWNIKSNNLYEFLSDASVQLRWNRSFTHTHYTQIAHQFADVRFETNGVRDKEIEIFTGLVTTFFYIFEQKRASKVHEDKTQHISTTVKWVNEKRIPRNYVQFLKSFDPKLYDIKKHMKLEIKHRKKSIMAASGIVDTHAKRKAIKEATETESEDAHKILDSRLKTNMMNYSKICQKPYQPLVLSKSELEKLKKFDQNRVVKFWNFTTKRPAYYICPTTKYPFLRFIVKRHPLNYCIPCCKKIEIHNKALENLRTKNRLITGDDTRAYAHKICMESFEYTKERRVNYMSRYIMMYGKVIEPGRLSQLPGNSLGPLFYESNAKSSDPECKQAFNYYLFGVAQSAPGAEKIGLMYTLAHALNLAFDVFLEHAAKHTERNLNMPNVHLALRALARAENVPISADFDNVNWNKLAKEIAALLHINLIHFIETGTVGIEDAGHSEVKLVLPSNVKEPEDFLVPSFRNLIVLERYENFYPIYGINTESYFATHEIETRLFPNHHGVIYIINELILRTYKNVTHNNSLNLSNYMRFCEYSKIKLQTLYINRYNICYAILHDDIYVTIEESNYMSHVDPKSSALSFKPANKTQIGTFKQLQSFIKKWNAWIAESNRVFSEEKVPLMISALIQQSNVITTQKKYIGFQASNLDFYCTGDIDFKGAETLPIHTVLYDPFDLNSAIYETFNIGQKVVQKRAFGRFINAKNATENPPLNAQNNAQDNVQDNDDNELVKRTFYDIWLYRLLLLEFKAEFDKQRNFTLRNKIKNMLKKANSSSKFDYEILLTELSAMLDSSRDINMMRDILFIYAESNIDKNSFVTLLDTFDRSGFDFDMIEMNALFAMEPKKLRIELGKIAKKLVIVGDGIGTLENMFSPCGIEKSSTHLEHNSSSTLVDGGGGVKHHAKSHSKHKATKHIATTSRSAHVQVRKSSPSKAAPKIDIDTKYKAHALKHDSGVATEQSEEHGESHCKKGKLFVPRNRLEKMLDILTADMLSIKAPWLFSKLHQNVQFFAFIRRPYENLRITL